MHCQRFFKNGPVCGWFAVLLAGSLEPELLVVQLLIDENKFLSEVWGALAQLQNCTTVIVDREGKNEPNPWLKRVGCLRSLVLYYE